MDNQTLQKLKDTLVKSNNIGIAVGADPSVDSMAGALSLYLLLKAANKQVSVASPTDPIVELSSLVGINRVQRNLGGEANDLVVSFPYVEGEIEKVSYTLEEGFLNIIVKASEQGLSFDESDVKYTRGSGTIDLLIVVGTPRLAELEDVFDSQKLRDVRIINIDNKDANQGFGDIVLVSSKFSSVSEQVADLAMALGFRMDQDVAQNLLTGITTETKNFQTPNVTPLTFEMMALLMKRGAARRQIESPQGFSAQMRSQYDDSDEVADRPAPRPAPKDQQQRQDDRRQQQVERRPQPQEDRRPQQQPDRRPQQQADRRPQEDRRPREDQRSRDDRQEDRRPQQQPDRRPQQQPDDRRRFDDRDRQQSQRQDEQRRREDTRQAQQNQNQDDDTSDNDEEPPLDWLTPKVYKGSSDVE